MANCNDELSFVCEECYQVVYDDCETITVDVGLTALTSYCIKLYDKFGNTYEQTITTTAGGAFTINLDKLPDNFFNPFSGKIELQIFANCNTETRIQFTAAYTLYSCLLLVNSEDEDIEDVNNDLIDNNFVRIENQDGDLIVNVLCGDTYEVIQWSGIDEGDQSTIYTDGITDE